jgi:hypothetical protein
MPAPSAILAISSLDRFTVGVGNTLSRFSTALLNSYDTSGAPVNRFQLSSNGAFIYGYINRITVSQMQIEYKVPTIVPSNLLFNFGTQNPQLPKQIGNDTFVMFWENGPNAGVFQLTIPYGFYTPEEMAAMLEVQIRAEEPTYLGDINVAYESSGGGNNPANPDDPTQPGDIGFGNSFVFFTTNGTNINFPTPEILIRDFGYGLDEVSAILKCYKMLGVTLQVSSNRIDYPIIQTASPNFLYTPFIDVVSNNLTKFQKVKDASTFVTGRTGLLQRVYLSGVGNPQATSAVYALGSQPFIITTDLNTPKVIRWNKDETVYNIDFELYDCYGDPLYWTNENATEFQMTLLCYEPND